MKPVHVALLVLGAALAGGLAVKMTQAPPVPVSGSLPTPPSTQPAVSPAAASRPVQETAVKGESAPEIPATAPPPIYIEKAKPAIRKNEPIVKARVDPPASLPKRYDPPAEHTAPQPEPQLQAAVQPPPVSDPGPAAPEPLPPPPPPAAEPAPLAPAPRHVTLTTGMLIPVRLNESLSSDRNAAGDTFNASLAEPLVIDGLVIAERGARVTGRVVEAQKAGRLSGTAVLQLALSSLSTSDGQRIAISTEPWTKQGEGSRTETAEKIGGGAALGAIIGAIAGGGKGAAIGAGVGGGAGVGAAAATGGKPANVATETVIRFRLASRVTITERP